MLGSSKLVRRLRPLLRDRPRTRRWLVAADRAADVLKHSAAGVVPGLIRPRPRQLTVAVTALCNLRCTGCRYGRDFMPGASLDLETMRTVLEDARAAGVFKVRLYGGEPLLHPDLPAIIEHATGLGLDAYVTTNGTLLERRIDELYAAGLRWLTLGFYGVGEEHARYTGRPGTFEDMERGVARIRDRYGADFAMQLNYVLLRPMCNRTALAEAWDFARRYDMYFHLDLIGYSVPYFANGEDGELLFRPEDEDHVRDVTAELLRLQAAHPERFPHSRRFLRSIPDWLLLGPDMKVPCDAYELVWIGADGIVQLCDSAFPLGNVNEARLRDILFGESHVAAARDAFLLKCGNCTCKVDSRINKHAASRRRYRR